MQPFKYMRHPHRIFNPNLVHRTEMEAANVNTQLAVFFTRNVGTMWAAYSFAALALIGLLAILGVFPAIVALLIVWASQTFIQLVMLPILSVGQNVLGRKAELQAEETYKAAMNSYHDLEQMHLHLDAQDRQIAQLLAEMQELTGKRQAV